MLFPRSFENLFPQVVHAGVSEFVGPGFSAAHNTQPTILLGVTHSQTCLVLGARLRTLRRAGFRVVLISSPGDLLNNTASREGVECCAIPMRRGIALLSDVVALLRLWRILGKYRPEIVEFSTPKAGLLGTLAAWLRGVPCRVYMLRGLKLERSSGLKRQLLLATERLASACAQVVLCNSESLRAETLALRIAPSRKLHLLGEGSSNGVDMERFSPGPSGVREQFGISLEAPVVGFVGRLTRDKGLPELIQAFDAIQRAEPAARLLLVGWFDAAEDAVSDDLRAHICNHPGVICAPALSTILRRITAEWMFWSCRPGGKDFRMSFSKLRLPEFPL